MRAAPIICQSSAARESPTVRICTNLANERIGSRALVKRPIVESAGRTPSGSMPSLFRFKEERRFRLTRYRFASNPFKAVSSLNILSSNSVSDAFTKRQFSSMRCTSTLAPFLENFSLKSPFKVSPDLAWAKNRETVFPDLSRRRPRSHSADGLSVLSPTAIVSSQGITFGDFPEGNSLHCCLARSDVKIKAKQRGDSLKFSVTPKIRYNWSNAEPKGFGSIGISHRNYLTSPQRSSSLERKGSSDRNDVNRGWNYVIKNDSPVYREDASEFSDFRRPGTPFPSRINEESSHNSRETGGSNQALKPSEIVKFLDEYVVGQSDAKRAVANALRSRWRRRRLTDPTMREDIVPKNILMIGPTGVGKTEIARRMARIIDAPFIKVEATKYTEVGFHGQDVDNIIKDLVDLAVRQQYTRLERELMPGAKRLADQTILCELMGQHSIEEDSEMYRNLEDGLLDDQMISLDIPSYVLNQVQYEGNESAAETTGFFGSTAGGSSNTGLPFVQWTQTTSGGRSTARPRFGGSSGENNRKKQLKVREARRLLAQAEYSRLLSGVAKAKITQQAVDAVQQDGIVFLDEIDKICSSKNHNSYSGPDASAEGVQRDLLPLIEGTSITTRHGNIRTDHILFIASGAFHSVKPSDMMSELQGRLPVRVVLEPLSKTDLKRILVEPHHNLIQQHVALLAAEDTTLIFENEAIDEIANVAYHVNLNVENIGARRLITVLEKIVENISYDAPDMEAGSVIRITKDDVRKAVEPLTAKIDLHRFIL